MRKSSALLVAAVLSMVPTPGSACPWFAPTDPCASETAFESEFIRDLPDPARFSNQEVVEIVTECALTAAEEEAVSCAELVGRIVEPNLGTLEELIDYTLDLETCPEGIDVLRRAAGDETDDFLVYRLVEALVRQGDDPLEILGFLEHDSPDVRRKAAELLEGEPFDDEQSARVTAALLREEDPWTQLAIAATEPEGHADEVTATLTALARDDGPAATTALKRLSQESLLPVVEALEHRDRRRAAAILLLGAQASEPQAREALLGVMDDGSSVERLHAAAGLVFDRAAAAAPEWRRFVLDPRSPIRQRAVLLLKASYRDPWRSVACEAKRADAALSSEVDQILSDQEGLRETMVLPSLGEVAFERNDRGTVRPQSQASVRCASSPGGPPRSHAARIRSGAFFAAFDWFTRDGTPWLGGWTEGGDSLCWIPSHVLDRDPVPQESGYEDVLEADVPLSALDALRAALAAGDLETFDQVQGFSGIRLRGATAAQKARWHQGVEGRLAVLAQVEMAARERAARGLAHRAGDDGGE